MKTSLWYSLAVYGPLMLAALIGLPPRLGDFFLAEEGRCTEKLIRLMLFVPCLEDKHHEVKYWMRTLISLWVIIYNSRLFMEEVDLHVRIFEFNNVFAISVKGKVISPRCALL